MNGTNERTNKSACRVQTSAKVKSNPDSESGYGSGLRLRTPNPDYFQNLMETSVFKGTLMWMQRLVYDGPQSVLRPHTGVTQCALVPGCMQIVCEWVVRDRCELCRRDLDAVCL